MDTDEVLLLGSGFCSLSGKKRAEILGMAKALIFAQVGNDQKATAPINAVSKVYGRNLGSETGYAGQRITAL
jgi:hypothetical protein